MRVRLTLNDGIVGIGSISSGASTGENEAVELRDGDPKVHNGKGVLKAVSHVNDIIAPAVTGMEPWRQADIDGLMIELDSTPNKARLGANAILGVPEAGGRGCRQGFGAAPVCLSRWHRRVCPFP